MKTLVEKITAYWDAQPCNVKNSLSEPGTEKYWNEISARRYLVESHLLDFAQFHLYQGKRVLEVGCGIATDGAEFAKHGAEYVGIDLSTESIGLARQRFEVLGLDGEFHVHNGEHDLSKFGEFDMVYCMGVLHHYPTPEKIIDNIYKILKPNGEFKFLVYARNSWKYAMIQRGLDQYEAQAGCPYAKTYTKEEIYNLLDGKFQVARIRQDHCFMYNVAKYKQGIYELEPWFEAMPEMMRTAVKEYLGWHLMCKSIKIS